MGIFPYRRNPTGRPLDSALGWYGLCRWHRGEGAFSCPRRGRTALAQGQHAVRSPGLVEVEFSHPEGVQLHGERWILVEWIGAAFRVMSPPWGFGLLVGGTQDCVALLLTLGFISVSPWGWKLLEDCK